MSIKNFAGIMQKISEENEFSGVVWVEQAGSLVFQQAYGFAKRADEVPNQIDTRFQTASGSKIFTALAVCQLIERGLLRLDTTLGECLPGVFSNFDPNVTVEQLLTHTSGITSYFEEDVNDDYEALWKEYPLYKVEYPRDFLPLFQHKQMKFGPGERFDYNDGGFIILGMIIEQVCGCSFRQFIQENIFEAAGMKSSGYFYTDRLPANTADACIYEEEHKSWRTNIFCVPYVGAPDGGAYVSAPDLSRFWHALLKHRFLSPDNTDRMLSEQVRESEEDGAAHYGYGVWIEKPQEEIKFMNVEGWDPGVSMLSACSPDGKYLVTILGNTNCSVWKIFRALEVF